ncbi:Elicitor-responsive protein [Zostera marina]|uniref:Elicitor-responsive protein n=1 Tax=Zostera marina TaxID=29655 RepID=A0A0K9PIU7_ZOSMR|nr:Elicitor-responsive protein [Zostera marina]
MHSSGIHGQTLEITVVGCTKLRDKEWISRQDPYVCLQYGSTVFRTRTCTDGGKNPTFNEKFTFPLIQGLGDISVVVWNSNTLTSDDFIGSGKIQLSKVLSQGYDDSTWSVMTKRSKYGGEVRIIMHFANPTNQHQHAAPQHSMPSPYVPLPPHASYSGYPPNQSHQPSYQPVITPHPQQSYPPPAISYAPSLYSQQTHSSQQTYPSNQVYPPSPNPYPPTGPYQGIYPPPPY